MIDYNSYKQGILNKNKMLTESQTPRETARAIML